MTNIATISNQVTNTFTQGAAHVAAFAKEAVNFGGRAISAITPSFVSSALSEAVRKIQSLNVPAFLSKAWAVAKSDVGISGLLLTGSVALAVAAHRTNNKVLKYALLTLGVATLGLTAYIATRPIGPAPVSAPVIKA